MGAKPNSKKHDEAFFFFHAWVVASLERCYKGKEDGKCTQARQKN
jgi:hypothetical protein